jgi:hypothetical protein
VLRLIHRARGCRLRRPGSAGRAPPPAPERRVQRGSREPELAETLRAIGSEPVTGSTLARAARHISAEIARWRRVVAETAVTIERR